MQAQPSHPRPSPDYPRIGVAVNAEGSHVGILYRFNTDNARLLHLGWHHQLHDDDGLRPGYAWAECSGFDETEGRDLASWLKKIYRANIGRIPYGFNYWPGACFDGDGVFTPSKDGLGLTCATFVMALFEAKGFEILSIKSWQPRDDDKQWFEWVVSQLRMAPGASKEHIEAQVQAMDTAVRFRPLEVAASAAMFVEEPIQFNEAVSIAQQFKDDLSAKPADKDAPPLCLIPIMPADVNAEQDSASEKGSGAQDSAAEDQRDANGVPSDAGEAKPESPQDA